MVVVVVLLLVVLRVSMLVTGDLRVLDEHVGRSRHPLSG